MTQSSYTWALPISIGAAAVAAYCYRQRLQSSHSTGGGALNECDAMNAAAAAAHAAETDELLVEQLSRNTQFLGAEGQERVASALVVVVGLGGVGSHCAGLLARTGVRRLRVVDDGLVTERSVGSHALAGAADVGQSKADVTRRALLRIVPQTSIEAVKHRLTAANARDVIRDASFVVLCLPPAPQGAAPEACSLAAAIAACDTLSVRTVAVLYSEAVATPVLRTVAHQRLSTLHDINCSVEARRLVARLRRIIDPANPPPLPAYDTAHTLLCVHAGEHASHHIRLASSVASKLRATATAGGSSDHADSRLGVAGSGGGVGVSDAGAAVHGDVRCDGRCAILAGMGDAAASACLTSLAGVPLTPTPGIYSRANRDDAHRALIRRERETFGAANANGGAELTTDAGAAKPAQLPTALDVWPEDCEYLVMEVWGGRCVLSGACIGGGGPSLVLTRWDRSKPASVGNLVLLSKPLAEAHDSADDPFAQLPQWQVRAVQATLERASLERASWAAQA